MNREKPFQGIRTFLKAKTEVTDVDPQPLYAVVGLPMDCATTNRPGARFGPAAVRDASMMLTDGYHPKWMNNPVDDIVDFGDIPLSNTQVERSLFQITESIDQLHWLFKSPTPAQLISIGGDHSVTLGVLRSLYKVHGKLAIVHFDAHSDCSIDHLGDPIGHGTWVRNAIEEGLIEVSKMTSIGVRAPTGKDSSTFLTRNGGRTISSFDAMSLDPAQLAVELLLAYGDTPCYLTFDVDGLDPSQAPGTGTPEIAGLTTMWCLQLIHNLQRLNWIGMDVVEVAPAYDHSQITALAAATIAWTYICMQDAK